MARKPEPPKPTSWDIYRVANKAKLLRTADNAGEAIKKVAEQFKTDAWRLIAMPRLGRFRRS